MKVAENLLCPVLLYCWHVPELDLNSYPAGVGLFESISDLQIQGLFSRGCVCVCVCGGGGGGGGGGGLVT